MNIGLILSDGRGRVKATWRAHGGHGITCTVAHNALLNSSKTLLFLNGVALSLRFCARALWRERYRHGMLSMANNATKAGGMRQRFWMPLYSSLSSAHR